MKTLFITTLILQLSLSMAQDNTEDPTDKPSWSEELPEMIDAPEINLDSAIDTNIDFGSEELGLDRSDMFDDSEDVSKVRPEFGIENVTDSDEGITDDNNQTDQDIAAAEQAAADKIIAENAVAEQAAADKIIAENAAAEQAAADKIIAENAAAEQAEAEKIATDKAVVENDGTEQTATDQLVNEQEAEESTNEQVAVETLPPQSNQKVGAYQWVQTKNVAPKYPSRAARSGETGWVNVELEINVYGDVVSTNVVSSYRNSKTFYRAATDAVKKWKFDSPMDYGIEENQFRIYKIIFKF